MPDLLQGDIVIRKKSNDYYFIAPIFQTSNHERIFVSNLVLNWNHWKTLWVTTVTSLQELPFFWAECSWHFLEFFRCFSASILAVWHALGDLASLLITWPWCWRKKSCYPVYPILIGVFYTLYIPGGCLLGFLPSTVSTWKDMIPSLIQTKTKHKKNLNCHVNMFEEA